MPRSAEAVPARTAWPRVPPEVARVLWPDVDSLTDLVIQAIHQGVPEYARPDDESYARMVRRAVETALHDFIGRIAASGASGKRAGRDQTAKLFRRIGRIEAAEGRSLESLQTALRLAARVAWKQLHERARQGALDIEVFAWVGEAIFLYLDELAEECAAGYTQARAEFAGEMERRRHRLLDLILADPPASPAAIAELARAADWLLPRKVAAVALTRDGAVPLPSMQPDVLVDITRADPCLLMPDPDGPGRAALFERCLRGWPAAIGPAMPLDRASSSLRWAKRALSLAQRGIGGGRNGLVRCDEHMSTLLILSDEELAREFGGQVLAPLRQLRPDQQDRLAWTLLAWLQSAGNAGTAARRLHVHPQTVRYRLRQITELFGDALDDPGTRLDLQIALRARELLNSADRYAKA